MRPFGNSRTPRQHEEIFLERLVVSEFVPVQVEALRFSVTGGEGLIDLMNIHDARRTTTSTRKEDAYPSQSTGSSSKAVSVLRRGRGRFKRQPRHHRGSAIHLAVNLTPATDGFHPPLQPFKTESV